MPASSPAPEARRQNLGDSLGLIVPALKPELVGPASLPWLTAVAAVLPPIHRAGFECRMADGDDSVDLQQGVPASDEEPARLARFLRAQSPLTEPWQRVLRLAERWADADDPLHDRIWEAWLELDADRLDPGTPLTLAAAAPSVFTVLGAASAATSLGVATDVITLLAAPGDADGLVASLRRCHAACPPPARISHVGLMLGRPIASMRVHLSPVPLAAVRDVVDAIGWAGDSAQVQSLAQTLLDYGDLMVLCLDVIADQVLRIGLECFFARSHGLDPRWPLLLNRLTEQGHSSAAKASALLAWPTVVTPLTVTGAWPEDLIVRALQQPATSMGVLDRRNSHVKLSCLPDGSVTAKAYFGYGHVWLRDHEPPAPERPRPPGRPAASAAESVGRAVKRLLAARNQGGWWRDFFDRGQPPGVERLVTDGSDEWVTAYVGWALAGVASADSQSAARDALALLLRRTHGAPGWGYHALVPPDGDSTTWVLRLAQTLAAPAAPPLIAGRWLVQSLTRSDGTVATYPTEATAALAEFRQIPGSYAGWCAGHMCVTAVAAALDGASAPVAALLAGQRPDGSWRGHWWNDDEYTTARAVEALARQPDAGGAVAAGLRWCAERIGDDGAVRSVAQGGPSPFATALALSAIRAGAAALGDPDGATPAADRAERWLLAHQLDDGRWEPSARMRMPAPSAVDPEGSPQLTVSCLDDAGLFTTATVLAALSAGAGSRR
jgi:squalene-hopene/tetraprenyl-beta-curcumene cyclase